QAQVDAAGVRLAASLARAERAPERFAVDPGLQVPQRAVDRGDRALVLALVAALEDVVLHLLPQPDHAARVLADDQVLESADRRAAADRHAGDPLVGVDERQRAGRV